jgi:hemerythrin superfamily protein
MTEADMEMQIEDVRTLNLASQDPATLRELLSAGKKLPPEATGLLMQDHAEVKAMYRQCETEESDHMKAVLATKICTALTVHAQIEEEIFYPQAEKALEDDDQVEEAIEEHSQMKEQISTIMEGMAAEKPIDPDVEQLMQLVEHHVEEEESEMFPDMRETDTDLYALGSQLAARRVDAFLGLKRSVEDVEASL